MRSSAGSAAAYLFLAPAAIVIGLFFLLPVAAAFAISLTDFDLYALADLKNLRFVGLAQLRARSSRRRCSGRRSATRSTSWRSAGRCRSRPRSAPRSC